MAKKVTLKKEIEAILENAHPVRGLCVSERINEQGFKCTYCFPENMREEILQRASKPKRQQTSNGSAERIQKGLALLEKNREAIQVLFDIRYLMEKHSYDVQKASRVLFKDKKELPAGFRRESVRAYYGTSMWNTEYHIVDAKKQRYSLKHLIGLLPILPKAWLKDVEV